MSADSIRFFATKEDMENYFKSIKFYEQCIFYDDYGRYDVNENIPIYHSIEELPDLGFTNRLSHSFSCYVVIRNGSILEEEIMTVCGKKKKRLMRPYNADAIHFRPSGINTEEKCIIHGQIDSISYSPWAKKLFNQLCYRIRKQSTGLDGWWVGNEAMELYGKYRFITIGIGEPAIYDFTFNK